MGFFDSLSYGICGGKSCYREGPVTTGPFFVPSQGHISKSEGVFRGFLVLSGGVFWPIICKGVSVYVGVL